MKTYKEFAESAEQLVESKYKVGDQVTVNKSIWKSPQTGYIEKINSRGYKVELANGMTIAVGEDEIEGKAQ